ncbi:MAG: short-chain dehydrogenase [Minwuia thermotolerans]|nr:MAG: short-chain dehydrogenase [Minwuia thermotolerans]
MGRLDGKVVWITGAASGLGRASALACAAEGATILATDLDAPAAVVTEIEGLGGQATALTQDVTDEARWDAIADEAETRFGGFQVLVNNAGVGASRLLADTDLAFWRKIQSVNLDAVFLGTRTGFRRMAPGGSIINISSVLGIVGNAGTSAYSASKGGVRLFSKSAAVEAAQTGLGIRVNSVHPGYIGTPMVMDNVANQAEPEKVVAMIRARHPVGHLGEPEDIANAVVYLASDDAKFVTGTEIIVDGGYTAW